MKTSHSSVVSPPITSRNSQELFHIRGKWSRTERLNLLCVCVCVRETPRLCCVSLLCCDSQQRSLFTLIHQSGVAHRRGPILPFPPPSLSLSPSLTIRVELRGRESSVCTSAAPTVQTGGDRSGLLRWDYITTWRLIGRSPALAFVRLVNDECVVVPPARPPKADACSSVRPLLRPGSLLSPTAACPDGTEARSRERPQTGR